MIQIFFTFLKLGLTSFGGPVAHLGFFHHEFVARKKWISEQEYADLVALCQLLPGPASSQVGMAIGFYRAGLLGSGVAWLAFTLPSALLLMGFALSLNSLSSSLGSGWLHGLKVAAVAVVAQAVWEMARKFCPSFGKKMIALAAALTALYFHQAGVQIGLILAGAVLGILFLTPAPTVPHLARQIPGAGPLSFLFLALFLILLVALPFAAAQFHSHSLELADVFYRVGALVFGGGHVVLPLLQSSVVDSGWVTQEAFVAGYGAAQAIPGPLFSFSAYLGFMNDGWQGAFISLVFIFLPSFLLIIGVLPHWEKARANARMRSALVGVNAIVVGLLLAALYNPVATTALLSWKDFILVGAAFWLLTFKKVPSYLIVIGLAFITALPFY